MLVTSVVVGAMVTLHYAGLSAPLERVVVRLLAPIQAVVFGISAKLASLTQRDSTAGDQDLAAQLVTVQVENQQLKVQLDEYRAAQSQLEFLAQRGISAVVGRVIGEEVVGGLPVLLVNRGSADGVQVGVPVLVQGGILIGKVISVSDSLTQVLLLSDPRSQTAGAIDSPSRIIGVVTGELGLGIRMDLIPKDSAVAVGETVITSGAERRIPRGLIIGRIAKLEPDATGFFLRASLQPPVSSTQVTVVSLPVSNAQ